MAPCAKQYFSGGDCGVPTKQMNKMPTKMPNLYYWLATAATSQWMLNAYPENYKNYSGWVVRGETNDVFCCESTRVFAHYINGIIHRDDGPAEYSFSDSKTLQNIRYFIDGTRMLVVDTRMKMQLCGVISLDYKDAKLQKVFLEEKLRMIKELE